MTFFPAFFPSPTLSAGRADPSKEALAVVTHVKRQIGNSLSLCLLCERSFRNLILVLDEVGGERGRERSLDSLATSKF